MKIKRPLLLLFLSFSFAGQAQNSNVNIGNNELAPSANFVKIEAPENVVKSYFNPEAYIFSNKTNTTPIATFIFTIPTFVRCHWLRLSGELYVQRNNSWAEALLGPSVASKRFQGGIMFGYETMYNDLRIAPWVVYCSKNEKFYFNYYYEIQSKGNDWSMRGEIYYQVSKSIKKNALKICLGTRLFETNLGPEINLKKNKMYLFFAPMYGWDDNGVGCIIGLGGEFD